MLVHPIKEEECKPYAGRLVCVVLQDGTRHIGILSKLKNGKVILNDDGITEQSKGKRKRVVKRGKAGKTGLTALPGPQTAAFGPFGFGSRIVLDLAAITLLFLLFI